VDVRGSSPLSPTSIASLLPAKVAQLVELTTENRAVGGSSPPLGTWLCESPGFDGQILALSPLIPRPVIVGKVVVTQSMQGKEHSRSGYAAVAI
jgi:hypothetical protein